MRYNLESTLPINAFSPRGGRGPFSLGMTLEGGGNPVKAVTKPIGDAVKGVIKGGTQAVKAVQNLPGIKTVSDAATQAVKPIDQALVQLDKSVGKAIPGGWGTVAAVAASMIPGGQFAALGLSKAAALGGLGALTGSGVMHKGQGFNLQGAIAGGALAYGAASLATGLEGAAEGASKTGAAAVEEAGKSSLTQGLQSGSGSALTGTGSGYVPSEFLSGTSIGAGAGQGASALTPTANALAGIGDDFIAPAITSGGTSTGIGSLGTAAGPTEFGLSAALPEAGTSSVGGFGLGNIATPPSMLDTIASKASGTYDALTTPSNYTDFADSYAANVSKIGSGIKDLVTGAPGASAGFSASGASLTNTALPIMAGITGLDAIQAQRDYLDQQQQSGAISDADYQSQLAEINRQEAIARQSVAGSPFSTEPDRSVEQQPTLYGIPNASATLYANNPTTSGSSLYASNPASSSATLYASGGAVDNEMGFDDSPRGLGLGNMSNGFMNGGSTPTFAAGGQARFLSGGGDGMSDDIPATIEGRQEARLADGEFVVPADVVSHLGNGSSKAGAKQLYSMMDKVRHARTGNKKQGKEINPSKFLAT